MGDEKVKNEAMEIMGLFQSLPRLVVFDLDYTLWPFLSAFHSKREMPPLYPHAKGVLYAFKEKGVKIAIASRSPTAYKANAFLDKLGLKSIFVTKEIFSVGQTKKNHFQKINKRTGVPYNAMLFFYVESQNIEAASQMGVRSILVRSGVNLGALTAGLSRYSRNLASTQIKEQKWRKISQDWL